MPTQVNLYEAKTQLSRLVARAAGGEEIVIARGGVAVARLVPLARPRRQPGQWKGQVEVGPDFDAPLPADVLAALQGRGA